MPVLVFPVNILILSSARHNSFRQLRAQKVLKSIFFVRFACFVISLSSCNSHIASRTWQDASCILHYILHNMQNVRCKMHLGRCSLHLASCTLQDAYCILHWGGLAFGRGDFGPARPFSSHFISLPIDFCEKNIWPGWTRASCILHGRRPSPPPPRGVYPPLKFTLRCG